MIKMFESPLLALNAVAGKTDAFGGDEKHYGRTVPEMLAMAKAGGDDSKVSEAQKLLTKLELAFPETDKTCFVPSVSGAYPCVPDAILGLPEPMRAKQQVWNDGAPIKLGVCASISAGIDPLAYHQRAIAILAIVMQLTNTGRVVELWLLNTLEGKPGEQETVMGIKLENNPVSLSEAGMLLADVSFARRVPFIFTTEQTGWTSGRNIAWPDGFSIADNGKTYCVGLAKRMGFQMVLPPLHLNEQNTFKADPTKWMLAKYEAIQGQIDETA